MPLIHDCVPPFGKWDFHVFENADWNDPLPQFLDADEQPYDLTGVDLRLWVRPTWDHPTLLLYCSIDNGRIIVSDAANGLAEITVDQSIVVTLPYGRWKWFLRASAAASYREFGRGVFCLHAGNP